MVIQCKNLISFYILPDQRRGNLLVSQYFHKTPSRTITSSFTKNPFFDICCGKQDKKGCFTFFTRGHQEDGVNFTFFIRQGVSETKKVKNL